MIRPEDFGAVGDGTTDDTRALQRALDRAEGASLLLTGRRYLTGATLLVSSNTSLQGFGATILGRAEDGPVIASKAWATRAPTRGRTRIAGLRIEGTGRGTRQDGVVLFDFWSELADLEIVNTGGRGIVLTATDRNRNAAGGTLVENRVRRCIVRDGAGTAFFLGEPANGKLTDGDLTDCIGMARDDADGPIVSIGHAAGWTIRNLHTYGGRPRTAVEVRQAYFTRIADLYCEGFTETGLALPDIQTQVAVLNAQIVATAPLGPGAAFLSVTGHRDFPHPAADFNNVGLNNLTQSRAVALRNPGNAVAVGGMPLRISGSGAALVTPGSEPPPPGEYPGSATQGREPGARRSLTWMGRDGRILEVASRPVADAFAEAFLLTLTGRSPDGTLTTQFAGMLHWTRAQPDARAVLVDLVPFGPPVGFQRPPEAIFERRGDRLILTLSFTPVASGPGQLTIG